MIFRRGSAASACPELYSSSQVREVHSEKPNPQPLPYKGRGVRIKASLSQKSYPLPSPCRRGLGRGGERFGERSECTNE